MQRRTSAAVLISQYVEGTGKNKAVEIYNGTLATIDLAGFLVGAGALPPEPLHNLLYANGLSVRHVATAGRFQIFDGRLVIADEEEVKRRGGAVMEKVWGQLRAEGRFDGLPG